MEALQSGQDIVITRHVFNYSDVVFICCTCNERIPHWVYEGHHLLLRHFYYKSKFVHIIAVPLIYTVGFPDFIKLPKKFLHNNRSMATFSFNPDASLLLLKIFWLTVKK